jgi:hypothetical protein
VYTQESTKLNLRPARRTRLPPLLAAVQVRRTNKGRHRFRRTRVKPAWCSIWHTRTQRAIRTVSSRFLLVRQPLTRCSPSRTLDPRRCSRPTRNGGRALATCQRPGRPRRGRAAESAGRVNHRGSLPFPTRPAYTQSCSSSSERTRRLLAAPPQRSLCIARILLAARAEPAASERGRAARVAGCSARRNAGLPLRERLSSRGASAYGGADRDWPTAAARPGHVRPCAASGLVPVYPVPQRRKSTSSSPFWLR